MPTLSKTKKQTQAILRIGGISLLAIFIFMMGLRFLTFVKDILTPPAPPTASFGKLDPLPFPNQQKENIAYSLDTLSGFLPTFSDRAKVYKITMSQPTLRGLETTQEKVSQAGFTSNAIQISQDVYQWTNQNSAFQKRITINIFSSDFTLSSPFLITPSLQTLSSTEEQKNAIEEAKSFLSNMSLFPQDIDEDKTKITLYSIQNGALIQTSKTSNAKIVRVDFFQKDLDNLPIYYEKGITSTIDLLIGKQNNRLEVVDARYFYKNISKDFSTYAIKSAMEAFEELKQGKGYVASKAPDIVEVTIKKVLLGYYIGEGEANQDFLMPVVVFVGDNDFVAYVSAVRDEWINN